MVPMEALTKTFVLSSPSGSNQVLSELPTAHGLDPSRQRRAHQKSRRGCDNCKRRRVKCDEETPCANCARRRERCQRPAVPRRGARLSTPSPPAQILLPTPSPAVMNLEHMKLLHHFETATCRTLLFPPEVWGAALQLCFHYDFLMSAVLCVSARHLAALQPGDETYPTAATGHLCRALRLFRHELSSNFAATRLDAVVATTLLLQVELWSSVDALPQPRDAGAPPAGPPADRLFAVSSSLKQLFLKSLPRIADQPSVFLPQLRQDPGGALAGAAQASSDTMARYYEFYSSYRLPLDAELLGDPPPDGRGADQATPTWRQLRVPEPAPESPGADQESHYQPVISRLCLVRALADEAGRPDAVGVRAPASPELARYIFSFPVACHGAFAAMLQENDPHAVLLVYHFYRAARKLLPGDECWWAHDRAAASEATLRAWLARQSAEQARAPGP